MLKSNNKGWTEELFFTVHVKTDVLLGFTCCQGWKMMNTLRKSFLNGHKLSSFSRILVARYSESTGSKEYIDGLVKNKKLVVFMKGTPAAPRCGFSNAVVQILDFHGVKQYDSYNVLEDENLRQG